jgi:hypothetical protein
LSDDATTWLDANVYGFKLVLPAWVRLDNGNDLQFINATTIDELSNKLQVRQWGPPPALPPPQVAWRNYNNWLVNNRQKLIRDQADLERRMVNLRGRHHQPLTVVRFDQNNQNARPVVHNVLAYVSRDGQLVVMEPNDSDHLFRIANFGNWQLTYTISNGAQPAAQAWNNVFFTREYANRVGASGSSEIEGVTDACAGEQLWENESTPDSMWFGSDMTPLSFDPDGVSLSCPTED